MLQRVHTIMYEFELNPSVFYNIRLDRVRYRSYRLSKVISTQKVFRPINDNPHVLFLVRYRFNIISRGSQTKRIFNNYQYFFFKVSRPKNSTV